MDITYKLYIDFIKEEKYISIFTLILSLLINYFKINVISYINAKIISSINNKDLLSTKKFFYYFIIISIIYVLLNNLYKLLQYNLSSKLRQWTRYKLIEYLLLFNNENYSNINFTKLNSPIFRFSNTSYFTYNILFNTVIPTMTLLILVFVYFFYKNYILGFIFLIGNIILFIYLYNCMFNTVNKCLIYEDGITNIESTVIEILNNIDKIIFRGKIKEEMDNFKGTSYNLVKIANNYDHNVVYNSLVSNILVFLTIFCSLYYLIIIFYNNKINSTTFITFITILLLYRDILITSIQEIPSIIEMYSRSVNINSEYKTMSIDYNENSDEYKKYNIDFNNIKFKNIKFKYKKSNNYIYDNFSLEINTNSMLNNKNSNKIIGIVGLSGNGKSTFAKLLIKSYKYEGEIYIDDINIKDIDTNYLRKSIIFVNQNSKLFDKKIIENILYGCDNLDVCNKHLNSIMSYPKIKELYKNLNLNGENVGSGGEKLSGGQRQVINIINGLITPSKITVLDEPTNGLDMELKKDIIEVIKYFKQYKKCIIIISHDKDIYQIFEETINIGKL
jgi:ABC-type multidrug transport system fused ATPase/permease subunit